MKMGGLRHRVDNGRNFVISRFQGSTRESLCLLLHTPAYFTLRGGELLVRENHVVIIPEGEAYGFRGCGEAFIHDYFNFHLEEADQELWDRWNIPFSMAIPIGDPRRLSRLIEDMCFTAGTTGPFVKEILESYARSFFWLVSEAADLQRKYRGSFSAQYVDDFQMLRKQMYSAPGQSTTCEEAAKALHLSRSRFDMLYKQIFGRSYQADVINARIQYAKQLLQSSNKAVAEVAAACGYRNEEHFIRQFRQHTGMTPHQFRRSLSV